MGPAAASGRSGPSPRGVGNEAVFKTKSESLPLAGASETAGGAFVLKLVILARHIFMAQEAIRPFLITSVVKGPLAYTF